MEFFGVCEISLRPSEISDGKKEKNLYWCVKTGVREMECFSKQISFERDSFRHFVFKRRREEKTSELSENV